MFKNKMMAYIAAISIGFSSTCAAKPELKDDLAEKIETYILENTQKKYQGIDRSGSDEILFSLICNYYGYEDDYLTPELVTNLDKFAGEHPNSVYADDSIFLVGIYAFMHGYFNDSERIMDILIDNYADSNFDNPHSKQKFKTAAYAHCIKGFILSDVKKEYDEAYEHFRIVLTDFPNAGEPYKLASDAILKLEKEYYSQEDPFLQDCEQ